MEEGGGCLPGGAGQITYCWPRGRHARRAVSPRSIPSFDVNCGPAGHHLGLECAAPRSGRGGRPFEIGPPRSEARSSLGTSRDLAKSTGRQWLAQPHHPAPPSLTPGRSRSSGVASRYGEGNGGPDRTGRGRAARGVRRGAARLGAQALGDTVIRVEPVPPSWPCDPCRTGSRSTGRRCWRTRRRERSCAASRAQSCCGAS